MRFTPEPRHHHSINLSSSSLKPKSNTKPHLTTLTYLYSVRNYQEKRRQTDRTRELPYAFQSFRSERRKQTE